MGAENFLSNESAPVSDTDLLNIFLKRGKGMGGGDWVADLLEEIQGLRISCKEFDNEKEEMNSDMRDLEEQVTDLKKEHNEIKRHSEISVQHATAAYESVQALLDRLKQADERILYDDIRDEEV
tara:strand:- start:135 stop:506 length:372 start_codon:yes stop_codon:yes gene_type:complete